MATVTTDELFSLTGLDIPWPEGVPIPADEPTNLGDLFQAAGIYRSPADVMPSQATWFHQMKFPLFFMGKKRRGALLTWNNKEV